MSLPELGLTGFELVRVTRAGLVDVVRRASSTYVAGDVPIVEGVDLPGLFPDIDASVKAHVALHARDQESTRTSSAASSSAATSGRASTSSAARPVRSPADLKGLKVRVYGTAQTEFARAFGMEPVSIAFAETYTGARARHRRRRASPARYPGFALKFYEVTKYLVDVEPRAGRGRAGRQQEERGTGSAPGPSGAHDASSATSSASSGWEIGRRTTQEGIDENREKGMELIPAQPRRWRCRRPRTRSPRS